MSSLPGIMKPPHDALGRIARKANDYIAGWLRRQPSLKEESITDWLLDFFQQKSPRVYYYGFDRFEEARISGADWDWWFLLEKGSFKVRVQAKRLRRGKDHYSAFAQSNLTGYQIDLLVKSSAALNFYPLYLLYGATEGVGRCQRLPGPTVLSICSAHEVYNLVFGSPRLRIESKDALALTIPLDCLFRCPLADDFSLNGARAVFNEYFRASVAEEQTDSPHSQGYDESVPDIIRRLLAVRESDNDTKELFHEYQSIFNGSQGVVIVQLE